MCNMNSSCSIGWWACRRCFITRISGSGAAAEAAVGDDDHSTYNVDDLPNALPHFAKYRALFPVGRLYLKLHFKLVVALSDRIFLLSKIGATNLRRSVSERQFTRKVVRVHLNNYTANFRMQSHGLLAKQSSVGSQESCSRFSGSPFPTKGYEYGIKLWMCW